jgi:hypothetical protein
MTLIITKVVGSNTDYYSLIFLVRQFIETSDHPNSIETWICFRCLEFCYHYWRQLEFVASKFITFTLKFTIHK